MQIFSYNINDKISVETNGEIPYSEIEEVKIGNRKYPGNRIYPAWKQILVNCNGDLPECIMFYDLGHDISFKYTDKTTCTLKDVRWVRYDKDTKEIAISYLYFNFEVSN